MGTLNVTFFTLLSFAIVTTLRAAVTLSPDYAGLTVPPNIAPLNFDVLGAPDTARVTLTSDTGASETFGTRVRIPIERWRALLKGRTYTLTVTEGQQTLFCATNTVAQTAIDPVLVYRLIPPSYENYVRLGLYQRDLTSFEELPLYTNLQSTTLQCMNCHSFLKGDPDTFLFHLRADNPGTLIYRGKEDKGIKRNFNVGPFFSSGVYPAWHPSGQFVAFSVNDTLQCFYYGNRDKVEVLDSRSDMMLYDVQEDTVSPIELDPRIFDCFPTWSPDGTQLYSVAAQPGFPSLPEDKEERSKQAVLAYTNLCYNLIVRNFDAKHKTFTSPQMVLNAAQDHRSVTLPRVSPEGRWLIFTLGPQGVFHIWHKSADLWSLDLKERKLRPLTEINSPDVESYHMFSSEGRWMVFSSRREDGGYTRPYFTHFDAPTGTFTKPFILPQYDPAHHRQRMLSYNVPELVRAPIHRTPRDIRRLAEQPAKAAKYGEPQ
ncbi:MAG: hypothetical protein RR268_03000 [Kiritimatiellia bacterium]